MGKEVKFKSQMETKYYDRNQTKSVIEISKYLR